MWDNLKPGFTSLCASLCFQVSGLRCYYIIYCFCVRHFVCLTCFCIFQSYSISSFYTELSVSLLFFFLDAFVINCRTLILLASEILANQKSAVKLNQSVRSPSTFFVGASSIFIHKSLYSFHKFTPVFLQISYKPQTMAESSKRFIALDKPIEKYIRAQQNKKTRAKTRARKVSKKANMPWALCTTKSFTKQGNVWELEAKQSKGNKRNAAEALTDDEVNIR